MIREPIAASLRATIEAAMRGTRRPVSVIAAETGVSPATIRAWNRRHGWRPSRARGATLDKDFGTAGPDTDPRRLRAALRAHIARQIARFDAALSAEDGASDPKTFDSARVLRDLGGLKRLLDEGDQDERAGPAQGAGDGAGFGGHDPADHDLPALRAEIARRLAAACAERPDAGLPGESAAAPDPGAGP